MHSQTAYQEELLATQVGTSLESFTEEFSVLTVSFEVLIEGEKQVLSFQREMGKNAENPQQICIVLSPSQLCAYDPITKLTHTQQSLGMHFTTSAANSFGAASLKLNFSVTDSTYQALCDALHTLCAGHSFFNVVTHDV